MANPVFWTRKGGNKVTSASGAQFEIKEIMERPKGSARPGERNE
jgi:hypothetical protein